MLANPTNALIQGFSRVSVTTATCPQCGFEITHVQIGKKGQLRLDVVEWASLCEEPQKSEPGNCPHLNAQMALAGLPTFRS